MLLNPGKLKEDVKKALQELTQVEKELGEKHSILTLKVKRERERESCQI